MIITFINVGYGDSILIEHDSLKGRYNILVDGGKPSMEHYEEFSQRIRTIDYLQKKGIKKIDLMVITHLHGDHVGGLLDVASNIEVDEVWSNYVFPDRYIGKKITGNAEYERSALNVLNTLNIYNEICCILKNNGKVVREISGMGLDTKITDGLRIDVFGPERETARIQKEFLYSIYTEKDPDKIEKTILNMKGYINETCIALRLLFGNIKVLLCGDVYSNYWDPIIKQGISISADILKLSHHGRADGTSERFAEEAAPGYVVVSSSNRSDDKRPDPEVLKLFEKVSKANNKAVNFLFTDAVDIPPYSTLESRHNAVEFLLNSDGGIKYEFI